MRRYQSDRVMLYFEIKKMLLEDFTVSQISRKLGISRKTIYVYKDMSEPEFWEWVGNIYQKAHKLTPYEEPVKNRLEAYPDLSSYQVHDWLLEHYPTLKVSRRTVSNFVSHLRGKYAINKSTKGLRAFAAIPQMAYGKQAQVDFGEYKMKDNTGSTVKVYFMATVLSRSRYKHIFFKSSPFTTKVLIEAHEQAFGYFEGIPNQMVYDQDKLMIVSENKGDLVLTQKFEAYIKTRKFKLYVCRKSDPQSKGKVENVVKYVKTNFLKHRLFVNDTLLNAQGIAWLKRTGNGQIHGTTKQIPATEFAIEKKKLTPFMPIAWQNLPYKVYHVRKDNLINYQGNFYSLPLDTYQGKESRVLVKKENDCLIICDQKQEQIAKHKISIAKGEIVSDAAHRHDKERKNKEQLELIITRFKDQQVATNYFTSLYEAKPRYIRDQLQLIEKTIDNTSIEAAQETLFFCQENQIYSANDFKAITEKIYQDHQIEEQLIEELLLKQIDRQQYHMEPQKSNITDYEAIIKPK